MWLVSMAVFASVLVAQAPAVKAHEGGQSDAFDVLIVGGRVIDGTGNPAFPADVGLRSGRIAEIGQLRGRSAARVIDARHRLVVPGFIDVHSHAYDADGDSVGIGHADRRRRAAPNFVSQGITTAAVNPDGSSPFKSIEEQRRHLARLGIGLNVALFVGHNTIRRQVLGTDERRSATPGEIVRMRALVRRAMTEGAFGLSAGLEYVSGRWSTIDEVAALVEEIVPCDGVYTAHERSAGDPMWYSPSRDPRGAPTLFDATRETVEIGERTGATVIATHLKVRGTYYWGTSQAIIALIERARARGVDVWADSYPYNTTGSDAAMVLIPDWVFASDTGAASGKAGGRRDYAAAVGRVLRDTAATRRLRGDVQFSIEQHGGAENIFVREFPDSALVGRSLREVADARRMSPVDAALYLQQAGYRHRPGGGRLQGIALADIDVDAYAARPWVATSSDGFVALPEDREWVHPRYYGAFPRKLRYYALNRGVVTLEQAVVSMTSLPAQLLRLWDRGLLRPGFRADVVIFDPAKIQDQATFEHPHQYASGVTWVLVAGVPVVADSKLTWALPGQVLERTQRCNTPLKSSRR